MFESWLRSPTVPQELAVRAKILIASAGGEGVRPLAKRLEISPNTVSVWRRRYRTEGLAGVRTRARSGRQKTITPAKERAIVAATMRAPRAATHWSSRTLAKQMGAAQTILSIAHEETLRVFYAWFHGIPDARLRELHFANCEVLQFEFNPAD